MTEQIVSPIVGDDRLLDTLVRLHAIVLPELRPALDQAANLVAEALDAPKVDIFLHDVPSDSLVALGTSDTPLGRQQRRWAWTACRWPTGDGRWPRTSRASPACNGRPTRTRKSCGASSTALGCGAECMPRSTS